MANTNLGNAKAANVPLKSRCLTTFGTLRLAYIINMFFCTIFYSAKIGIKIVPANKVRRYF